MSDALALQLWLAVYALELAFFMTPLWRLRAPLAYLTAAGALSSSIALMLVLRPSLLAVLVPLTLFRLFNLARVIKGRMHDSYLRKVTRRTAMFLFGYHLLGVWLALILQTIGRHNVWLLLLGLQAAVGVGALLVTLANIRKLSFKMPTNFLADRDLPTVTVAIPARNETQDLEDCLRSVLASDYPKLEVLVLDDCSQERTADIIKSFAHDGVRFVPGQEPSERWLAKNLAYQKLYEESSGELVLFCGVDVRFGTGAIRAMVNLLHARDKQMLSVLPLRLAGSPGNTLLQPMRYWWELALPRRLFNRPAVLSTCWLIERAALASLGGFSSVSHTILPEGFFARELVKTDSYSFVRSSEELDIRTQKSLADQKSTAIRVRYPQARRRPEAVLAISLLEVLVFVSPLVTLAAMLLTGQTKLIILPLIALVALLITHLRILQATNPANVAVSVLTYPIAVSTELVIGLVSMFAYEFGSIEWKDRNVCIPVMHVVPHLPKMQ